MIKFGLTGTFNVLETSAILIALCLYYGGWTMLGWMRDQKASSDTKVKPLTKRSDLFLVALILIGIVIYVTDGFCQSLSKGIVRFPAWFFGKLSKTQKENLSIIAGKHPNQDEEVANLNRLTGWSSCTTGAPDEGNIFPSKKTASPS